jgi:hypothetical protein
MFCCKIRRHRHSWPGSWVYPQKTRRNTIMTRAVFADLHNHTKASDGDFIPEQLVARAKELGLGAVAITDHDTLKGIEPGLSAGIQAGIQVIPGVEVSVRFRRPFFTGTLHLLCYFPENRLSDPGFVKAFESVLSKGRGESLVRARIARINEEFGPMGKTPLLARCLVFQDIAEFSSNASRRHFALALSEKLGITDKEIIHQIIGNDSPAYLPSGIALEDVARFMEKQPLLAVLAHAAAGSFPGKGHYREVLPPVFRGWRCFIRGIPETIRTCCFHGQNSMICWSPAGRTVMMHWSARWGWRASRNRISGALKRP